MTKQTLNHTKALFAGSVSDKRVIVDLDFLVKRDAKGEAYSSIFSYDHQLEDYYKENKSISGFNGNTYGEWFILDLDHPQKEFLKVADSMIGLLNDLDDFNIKYHLFFSGGKGYHLYIHKSGIDYPIEYNNKWNMLSKLFALKIAEDYSLEKYIDESVYDKVRLFRLPFSRHSDTGWYKKPVSYNYAGETTKERFTFIEDSYKNKEAIKKELFYGLTEAQEGVEKFMTLDIDQKTKATADAISPSPEKNIDIGRPFDYPHCIWAMMHTKDFPKHRHAVALRLQSYFGKQGFSKDYVYKILETWNAGLDKQLPISELDAISKYYEKDYTYTCGDKEKKKYCSKSCKFYKTKDLEDNHIYTPKTFVSRYRASLTESTEDWIRFSDVYPSLTTSPTKPAHGQIDILVAGSSVGKTTFINNIMYKLNHIDWLFFSYDMSGLSFTSVLLAMTGLDINSDKQAYEFQEKIKHIIMIDDSTLYAENMIHTYDNICRITRKRPKAIVIDYLQIVPAKGNSAMERAISITKSLKAFAKERKVAIIALSQVPKDLAGDGNMPLGMNSAKDSGEIVNLADHVYTFWRPGKGGTNSRFDSNDNILRVRVAKDKYAEGDWETDLGWNKNYRITDKEQ